MWIHLRVVSAPVRVLRLESGVFHQRIGFNQILFFLRRPEKLVISGLGTIHKFLMRFLLLFRQRHPGLLKLRFWRLLAHYRARSLLLSAVLIDCVQAFEGRGHSDLSFGLAEFCGVFFAHALGKADRHLQLLPPRLLESDVLLL